MDLECDFLQRPVSEWHSRTDFKEGLEIVTLLRVVDDNAERAVKTFKDFNKIITKEEASIQNLVVTVDSYRKSRPNFKKRTLTALYDTT